MQTALLTEAEAQHLIGAKNRENLGMARVAARRRGQPLSGLGVVQMPGGSVRYNADALLRWAREIRPLGYTLQHERELMELAKALFEGGREEPLPDEGWEASAHEAALMALGADERVFAAKCRAWSEVGIKKLVKGGRTEAEAGAMIGEYLRRVGFLTHRMNEQMKAGP